MSGSLILGVLAEVLAGGVLLESVLLLQALLVPRAVVPVLRTLVVLEVTERQVRRLCLPRALIQILLGLEWSWLATLPALAVRLAVWQAALLVPLRMT